MSSLLSSVNLFTAAGAAVMGQVGYRFGEEMFPDKNKAGRVIAKDVVYFARALPTIALSTFGGYVAREAASHAVKTGALAATDTISNVAFAVGFVAATYLFIDHFIPKNR